MSRTGREGGPSYAHSKEAGENVAGRVWVAVHGPQSLREGASVVVGKGERIWEKGKTEG